jgi:hypothetical protein
VIGESLSHQGRGSPGVAGGSRLGEFLFHSMGPARIVPPSALFGLVLLGPIGIPLTFQWIEDHLPSGTQLRSGNWKVGISSNAGLRVSSGVFYGPDNQLRGNTIRNGIDQWIQSQVDNVVPAEYVGLNPRARLVANVGSHLGSGPYGIWQEGDPVLRGSKLATAGNVEDQMLEVIESSGEACEAVWEQQTETAQAVTGIAVLGAGQAAASAAAADKRAAEQLKLQQWAVVGGLGIAALLAARAIR